MSWFDSFPKAKVGDYTMLVDPADETIRKYLQSEGVWEPLGTELVNQEFTCGTFVDVGAHWGYYTLLAAKKAKMVYAFEANPYNFRYLCLNLLINKVYNVVAYPLALLEEARTVNSDFHLDNTGGGGVGWPAPSDKPQIQATTFDSLGLGPVDFIKVDCEGSDSQVIYGMRDTIATYAPKLLIESPPVEFLHGLGYRIAKDVGDTPGPLTYWRREA